MPSSPHYLIALLSNRIVPKIPLWASLLSSALLDILILIPMIIGMAFGLDFLQTGIALLPWFHGLFMSIVWSMIAVIFTTFIVHYHNSKKEEMKNNNSISRNFRTGLIIGLLVFSHWLVDFMAWAPNAPGLPLLFDMTQTVGLNLYSNEIIYNIVENGSYILIVILSIYYIFNWIKLKKGKKIRDVSVLTSNQSKIET